MQSYSDRIRLLSVLPAVWKKGSFSGLRTSRAFERSARWEEGILTRLIIKAEGGGECLPVGPGIPSGKDGIHLSLAAGKKQKIIPTM